MTSTPPRPQIALRVAVSGHRPGPRFPETEVPRVAEQIAQVLRCVAATAETVRDDPNHAWAFAAAPPALRLLSALAEGADRVAAQVSLAEGWRLDAALPLQRDDYASDFATEGRGAFDQLISAAHAVLELPGPPPGTPRDEAYVAVGRVLLDHCDLLLAVWDGGGSGGRGGTRAVLDAALRRGLPVIWIHATDAAAQPMLREGQEATPLDDFATSPNGAGTRLGRRIVQLLAPPSGSLPVDPDGPRDRLRRYLSESVPAPDDGPHWWNLHDRVTGVMAALARFGNRHEVPHGPSAAPAVPLLPTPALPGPALLAERHRAADAISTHLGFVYRSAYTLNFLLAALAVLVGLVAVFRWDSLGFKAIFVVLELLLVGAVLGVTTRGRRRRWHARWLDARLLAELLRHGAILAPAGNPVIGPLDSARSAVDPGDGWVTWYARAAIRELDLPASGAGPAATCGIAAAVDTVLAEQIAYHDVTEQRLAAVHHGLERAGIWLFAATAAVLALFLLACSADALVGAVGGFHDLLKHVLKPAAMFLGAGLPALGAALAGIRAQGDYETRADRSRVTAAVLRGIRPRLAEAAARVDGTAHAMVLQLAREAADAMLSDLGAWQLIYRHRPITIPG